ncbi:MAG TPA: tRNA (guanosine(37)-N1)-methyltransferase TrmD [Streptosporangiaceae bacterium]
MRIDIITIFPEYFSPLSVSLLGKAAARGTIQLQVHDLRRWADDAHHTVDDAPFGGGPGMVMAAGPWGAALDAVTGDAPGARLIVPTPSGIPFTQTDALKYSRLAHLVVACGRYEGIDARVVADARERMDVDEVSIGDYVLSGGEPAALVMIDAVGRLLPGVLGNAESVADDSFGAGSGPMSGLLEGPVYTRPRVWRGREVPPVLLSGDHAAIARWRRDEALRRTAACRPDLAARLAAGQASGTGESAGETSDPAGGPAGRTAGAVLDARDRQVLSEAGFPISGQHVAD